MNLCYEILADFLVAIHLGYMAYVGLGQLAIMIGWPLHWRWIRNPWFRVSHLLMILIVAVEAVCEYECPLTTWERDLRIHIGQIPANYYELPNWDVNDASFTARLLRRVMFFDASWGPFLSACYYTFAGIVLATVFLVPPRFRRVQATPAEQPTS